MRLMNKIGSFSVLAFATLVLAACTPGNPITTPVYYSSAYSPDALRYAVQDGELATEIRNNPFAGSFSDEAVARTLVIPPQLGPVRATTKPTKNPYNDRQRLVIVFNPARYTDYDDLCRAPERIGSTQAGDRLRMTAALCSGAYALSGIEGRIAATPASPQDPAFRGLMTQALADLLRDFDPNVDDNCQNPPNC